MRSNDGTAKARAKRAPAEPFDRLRRRLAHADDGWLFASIAAQVTERRLALGLSQVELARLCATSQSAIARLENGGRPPRIDTLLRLAEALDCDLAVELRPRDARHRPRQEDVMAAPTDVLSRIDEIEGELRGLSAELHEIRALVTQAAVAPSLRRAAQAPSVTRRAAPHRPPPSRPSTRQRGSTPAIAAARIHLSEGERSAALDELAARDRLLPHRSRGPAPTRVDPRRHRALSAVRAQAGRELAETARVAALEAEGPAARAQRP